MAEALQFLEGAYRAAQFSAPETAETLKVIARGVDAGEVDEGGIVEYGEALLNALLADLGVGVRVSVSTRQAQSFPPAPAARPARWFD